MLRRGRRALLSNDQPEDQQESDKRFHPPIIGRPTSKILMEVLKTVLSGLADVVEWLLFRNVHADNRPTTLDLNAPPSERQKEKP